MLFDSSPYLLLHCSILRYFGPTLELSILTSAWNLIFIDKIYHGRYFLCESLPYRVPHGNAYCNVWVWGLFWAPNDSFCFLFVNSLRTLSYDYCVGGRRGLLCGTGLLHNLHSTVFCVVSDFYDRTSFRNELLDLFWLVLLCKTLSKAMNYCNKQHV